MGNYYFGLAQSNQRQALPFGEYDKEHSMFLPHQLRLGPSPGRFRKQPQVKAQVDSTIKPTLEASCGPLGGLLGHGMAPCCIPQRGGLGFAYFGRCQSRNTVQNPFFGVLNKTLKSQIPL